MKEVQITDAEIRSIIEDANCQHPLFDLVRKFEDQAREITWESYRKPAKYWQHAEWYLFCSMVRYLISEENQFS